jgi:hypothetical protein
MTPIRLFVGADANNCDLESQAVVEYTARKYASRPVEIVWMQGGHGPWAGWQTGSARTPFTHFRWSIPSVCGYQGRAIYTDSDFIFRADLAELFDQDIPGVMLVRNPEGKVRTCCILFDCAKAKGHVPPVEQLRKLPDAQATLTNYFKAHRELMSSFAGDWNCVDLKGYDDINDPAIKAIHYSRMECQVHLKHAQARLAAEGRSHWYEGVTGAHWRPELQALFDQLLEEAIAAGYPPERYRIASSGPVTRRAFAYKFSKAVQP